MGTTSSTTAPARQAALGIDAAAPRSDNLIDLTAQIPAGAAGVIADSDPRARLSRQYHRAQ